MKYVDVDLLGSKIKEIEEEFKTGIYYLDNSEQAVGYVNALSDFTNIINSLQQEYPDINKIKREWHNKGYLKGRKDANIPARELGLPKSWDMQEQQKVDLEEEIHNYLKVYHLHIKDGGRVVFDNGDSPNFMCDIRDIARHFYELGFNARKEE